MEPDHEQQDNVASDHMQQAFHRLELEMVNMRTSLVAKVETVLNTLTKPNSINLDTRIESLEQLMKDNLKKQTELSEAIIELNLKINTTTNINIEASRIEKLASSVSNHPSMQKLSTTCLNCVQRLLNQHHWRRYRPECRAWHTH